MRVCCPLTTWFFCTNRGICYCCIIDDKVLGFHISIHSTMSHFLRTSVYFSVDHSRGASYSGSAAFLCRTTATVPPRCNAYPPAFIFAGFNYLYGSTFMKQYSSDDVQCGQVLRDFLLSGYHDVRFGKSSTDLMLRTIATA